MNLTLWEYVVIPTPIAKPPRVASAISNVTAKVYPLGTKYLVISPTETIGSTLTVILSSLSSSMS